MGKNKLDYIELFDEYTSKEMNLAVLRETIGHHYPFLPFEAELADYEQALHCLHLHQLRRIIQHIHSGLNGPDSPLNI